jgi:hypothetical protein
MWILKTMIKKVGPTLKTIRDYKHVDLQQGYKEFFFLRSMPGHTLDGRRMAVWASTVPLVFVVLLGPYKQCRR